MPLFHFNIFDGEDCIDREGTELPNWQAAQIEAIQVAGAILRDRARLVRLGEDWRMEVTDHNGLILFRLDFRIAGSAAISNEPYHEISDHPRDGVRGK